MHLKNTTILNFVGFLSEKDRLDSLKNIEFVKLQKAFS